MKEKLARSNRAYSYIRWSSPQQQHGDSLRRQVERARAYAREHGLAFVEDEQWEDAGKSAYRGRNWHEGALGAFVGAVDEGRVPVGSYLLVEALDRISRDKVLPALNRMKEITDRGITVVTLMDGRMWTSEALETLDGLYYLVGMFSTANIESRNKQDRLLASWDHKRQLAAETGKALTRTCPLWLTVDDEGRYSPIPERVEVVRKIYQMAQDGMGTRRIAKALNELGIPKFTDPSRPKSTDASGWLGSYVHRVLTNDATIGVWRAHRVVVGEDGDFNRRREPAGKNGIVDDGSVYPRIIDREVWQRVQDRLRGRKGAGGRSAPNKPVGRAADQMSNLFSGLCQCSCGATIRHHRASKTKRPKLVCSTRLEGAISHCAPRRWDYLAIEAYLLYALSECRVLEFAMLFPENQQGGAKERLDALEHEHSVITADLQSAEERAERIADAIENGTDVPTMHARLKKLEVERERLAEALAESFERLEEERSKPEVMTERLADARIALHEFIERTWRKDYQPSAAFGFETEEGYSQEATPLSEEDIRALRERLHQLLRGIINKLVFAPNEDGSGTVTLHLLPQGELTLHLSNRREASAVFSGGFEVPPMSLDDVPLRAGKGIGRRRLTKALLNVHADGDLNGDPEAILTFLI